MSFTAGMYLTNAGRIVLAAAQAGNAIINFSKFAFGDGDLGGGLEVERTALISQKDTQPITKIRANGDGTVTVGTKRPGSAAGGYYLREIGLFVTDPDNSTNDILYAYANAGTNAQYLPSTSNTAEIVEKTINVIVAIANGTTVTATIASGISLTPSDLEAHNSATDAHAARFDLLGAAAYLDVGAAAGKVAAGNHGHSASDVGAAPSSHSHGASDMDWTPAEVGAVNQVGQQTGATVSADSITTPFAVILLSASVNAELYTLLGQSYAYLLTLCYSSLSNSRVQLAMGYIQPYGLMAMRTYYNASSTWSEWCLISPKDITATLSATWTGSAAPYTQSIAISGMTAAKKIQVGLAPTATAAQYAAAAKAQLHCTAQSAGSITVTAFGTKPAIALPIVVRVVG